MAESTRCPKCGAEVPVDAAEGLCPNCAIKAAFGTQQTDSVSQAGSESGSTGAFDAQFVPPTPAELAPHFPDLEILELVGRGGMGVVYKARQKRLDRLVALKILAPKIGQDPAFAERFAREARAMAMLSHPHVVAVHDFGQTDGLYYFLMEFVDGVNLRRLLDTGKLVPEEALAIVPQICEALQYAHDHGVVHRDIKPENLLLDKEGRVKIADFGIAKLVGKETKDLTLTGAGQIMGTLQYMAPEQIEHPLQVDHRADIYSLGVVFYQMLTGELPIGRFSPPSKKVQIDVRLDEVVLRALEKEPERRYQQASEIKTQVESIVTSPSGLGATADEANRHGEWRTFLGIPLKERPSGIPQIVSWPGLGKAFIVLLVCGVAAILVKLAFQGISITEGIAAAILATTVIVIGCVWIVLKRASGPNASYSSPSPASEAAIKESRDQLKGPAIGLLVVGILNWILSVPLTMLALPAAQAARSMPLAITVILAMLVFNSLVIFAALKMKRLQAYGLAVAASILAIIISPGNLIGLPIGIWALVVLSQREVRTAFSENKDRKRVRMSAPASRREKTIGFAALVLCISGLPIALLLVVAAERYMNVWKFLVTIFSVILVALLTAIVGRRSVAGKAAIAISSLCLLAALTFLGIVAYYESARRVETRPRVASGDMARPADTTIMRGVAKEAQDVGQVGDALTPPVNWEMRAEGPVLNDSFARQQLELSPEKIQQFNAILQTAFRECFAAEAKHTTQHLTKDGHLISRIEPFPDEVQTIGNRLRSKLDHVLTPQQQRIARFNLGLKFDGVQIAKPGPIAWAGQNSVEIEIWRTGTWYHWHVRASATDMARYEAALPEGLRRFWKEPAERQAGTKEADHQIDVTLDAQPRSSGQVRQPKQSRLQFGPVIERVVNAVSEGKGGGGLDFAGGKVVDVPNEYEPWPEAQRGDWASQHSVDLTVDSVKAPHPAISIAPQGLKIVAVSESWDSDSWNHATLADLQSALAAEPGKFSIASLQPTTRFANIPIAVLVQRLGGGLNYVVTRARGETFAFQTRKGDLGLMQVVGFTDDPRGIRLRYKLVQPTAAPAPVSVPVQRPGGLDRMTWAKSLFRTTSHDFGTVARGAKAEYRFVVGNGFADDIHIKSVDDSNGYGGFKARITDALVEARSSTAEIVVTMDTTNFVGRRTGHITVDIDAPMPAKVVLEVTGYIGDETSAVPGVSPAAEMKVLKGKWNIVRIDKGSDADSYWGAILSYGSHPGSEKLLPDLHRLLFQQGVLLFFSSKEQVIGRLGYTINPTATPKTIDLAHFVSAKSDEPPLVYGIYKHDGKQLIICLRRILPWVKTEQRPTQFAIEPSSSDIVITLERPGADEKAIAGNWEPVSRVDDGKSSEIKVFFHVTVSEESENQLVIVTKAPNEKPSQEVVRFALEERKEPKRIAIRASNGDELLGIYKLDGERLTIASREGGPRPDEFESTPGSGVTLLVLERAKPGSDGTPVKATEKTTSEDNAKSKPPAGGSGAELKARKDKAEIVAVLKRRQAYFRSGDVTWSENRTKTLYVKQTPKGQMEEHFNNTDIHVDPVRFAFDGEKKMYYDTATSDFGTEGPGQPWQRIISAFNGRENRNYSPPGNPTRKEFALGNIYSDQRQYTDLENINFLAVVLACRPLHPVLCDLDSDAYTLVPEETVIDGHRCVELRETPETEYPGHWRTFWLDRDRDYVIVKHESRYRHFRGKGAGGTGTSVTVSYQNDAVHGWVPSGWKTMWINSATGALFNVVEAKVTKYAFNVDIPSELFDPPFPPGTYVQDANQQEHWVALPGGRKRVLTTAERKANLSYNELLKMEPKSEPLTPAASPKPETPSDATKMPPTTNGNPAK